MLKMLALYLYILIIGHKSCNMLSILIKLTLQKALQNVATNIVFLDKELKHNNNKSKKQHKNSCRSRELNPGALSFKADALPLHHRVN